MNEQQREGLALLGAATSGFYDTYRVAGPHNGKLRAHIMSLLTGVKTPVAKAGVTVLRETVFSIVKPEGNCLASREYDMAQKLHTEGFAVHANALQ